MMYTAIGLLPDNTNLVCEQASWKWLENMNFNYKL